jgi:hypothetical protein
MRSAVFVDFDNVFSQLRQLQPDAAERFARHPSEWIGWLTKSLPLPEPAAEGDVRRLLVRRCYLNPNWYQSYRHAFLRAGFEIVDCPPVTSQGKTSTDIHMVLDIIDVLQAETRCDEFIVFSADADFTPVLRRLRRHDRRTTVLAIGFPSAAYQASADLLIDERNFLRDALGFGPTGGDTGDTPGSPATAARRESLAEEARPCNTEASSAGNGAAATVPEPAAKPTPRAATPDELSEIVRRIWNSVEEAAQPVTAAAMASQLRAEYPEALANWNGTGSFKAFFRSLGLSRLQWLPGSGGRVMDPSRHELASTLADLEPDSPWFGGEAVFPVVRDVCVSTDAPMLAPRHLKLLIGTLAAVLREQPFSLQSTVQAVCRRCRESGGVRIRPRDVTFIVRGLQMNGHVFGQGGDDEATLSERLFKQVLFLCEREQKVLTPSDAEQIRAWIGASDSPVP